MANAVLHGVRIGSRHGSGITDTLKGVFNTVKDAAPTIGTLATAGIDVAKAGMSLHDQRKRMGYNREEERINLDMMKRRAQNETEHERKRAEQELAIEARKAELDAKERELKLQVEANKAQAKIERKNKKASKRSGKSNPPPTDDDDDDEDYVERLKRQEPEVYKAVDKTVTDKVAKSSSPYGGAIAFNRMIDTRRKQKNARTYI